ncbi:MAG: succinylglutamate desuccinylase/aspartoacylase family protein [Anaerolineales bacterium]
MTTATQVVTDVDYEKPGKQQGYLYVPRSHNEAAWANLMIPTTVVKNGTGPTLLATGGTHGDEYEGSVALMKLARSLQPEQIQGRAIIIPALNLPAARAGTRLSPRDGVNLNRAVPGKYNDTVTGLIAHYVSNILIPMADVVMDIHSGGKSLNFIPCVDMDRVPDEALYQKMLAVAKVWGTLHVFVSMAIAGEGMLPVEAQKQGKVVVASEMGGAGQCHPANLRITEKGIRNVMIHMGLMQGELDPQPREVRMISATRREDYHLAPADGIYEPFVEIGETVAEGEPLGQIHFPERPDRAPEAVIAKTSGLLVCRRFPAHTQQGDVLATIARPVEV